MEKEIKIDVVRCTKALFRKWYMILGCSLICGLLGYLVTMNASPQYYAAASVYSASYGDYQQTLQGSNVLTSYAEIVHSKKVADRAATMLNHELSAEQIMNMVSSSYDKDSVLLNIEARATSPQMAVKVANAIADSFVFEVRNIVGGDYIQVLDAAENANIEGISLKVKASVLAFLGMGVLLSGLIAMKEIFSDNIYHVKDASLDGELEIIGLIPEGKQV